LQRHPDVVALRETPAARHHADDRDLAAVDRDLLADDRGVAAEKILPDMVAIKATGAAFRSPSSARKLRPRIGCTPRNENVSAEMFAPRNRSGVSPLVMMYVAFCQTPIPRAWSPVS
jgi:hypothetical protein